MKLFCLNKKLKIESTQILFKNNYFRRNYFISLRLIKYKLKNLLELNIKISNIYIFISRKLIFRYAN